MVILRRAKGPAQFATAGLILLGFFFLAFSSCQSPHDPIRRTDPDLNPGWPKANNFFSQASYGKMQVPLPTIKGAEYVNDDELCATCHEAYVKAFKANNVHRNDSCEACHGPASKHLESRGKQKGTILSFKTLSAPEKSEICLKCHEESNCSQGAQFRYSKHAHCGVSCTDCHHNHYNIPPGTPPTTAPGEQARDQHGQPIQLVQYQKPSKQLPSLKGTSNHLGAVAPQVCYKCHADKEIYQQIAGPHQICGPNGFNCTTCHDPHGKIREDTRKELCLRCHKDNGGPVQAWHSSIHNINGVYCTDCHNPHPRTNVPRIVNIDHSQIKRPQRLMMSVQQPEACYKCHQKIFALNAMPSHHPIKEGKMVCTDCHDPHGQQGKNFNAERINDVCYKCHADKQGPFIYEHPPVEENCCYCHEPHGTVANNLLRQPSPFLCLRCHSGHRHNHGNAPGSGNDVNGNVINQRGFYTDCTQCHQQIHGSDLHGPLATDFMR